MNPEGGPRPHLMLILIAAGLAAPLAYRGLATPPPPPPGVPLSALAIVRTEGAWNAPGHTVFAKELVVDLGQRMEIRGLDLSVDNNDTYRIDIASDFGFLPIHTIGPVPGQGITRHEIRFASPTLPTTRLRIVAVSGDGMYALGHLFVW